jgi:EpsI family protein
MIGLQRGEGFTLKTKIQPYYLTLILIGVTSLGIFYYSLRPALKVINNRLDNLPMRMSSLNAKELHFEDSVYAVLNADGNLLRNYVSPEGDSIGLYIGYYGTAKGGRATHLPQYCFTGQGWGIEKWDFVSFESPGIGEVRVNRMIVKKGLTRQLIYFWFQSESTVMATGLEQNWYKFQHKFLYNRNDGSFIRVSMPLPTGQEDRIEEQVQRFSVAIMPLVFQYWPIEVPVRT